MNDLISVIVPVYNTKEYLNQCLSSILNQAYQDLEVILIDDASSDGSSALCDHYKENDSRVQIWHMENHKGVSYCRNYALNRAKGKWISFIDSDDWIALSMYQDLLDLYSRTLADTVCCGAWICEGENQKLSRIWLDFTGEEHVYSEKEALGAVLNQSGTLWNKLYTASIAKTVLFDTDLKYGEDLVYLAQYLAKAGKVAVIKKPEYYYRLAREGNVVSAGINEQHLNYFKATEQLIEVLCDNGENFAAVERAIDAIIRVLYLIPVRNIRDYMEYIDAAKSLSIKIKPIEKNVSVGKSNFFRYKMKSFLLILVRRSKSLSILYSKVLFKISRR